MSSEIAARLSDQTRHLVSKFEDQVDAFGGRNDLLPLTVPADEPEAFAFAREFFGEGEFLATGIDGSMDYDERLQMMLFYSNATAYSCPFTVGERLSFDLKQARREGKLSASCAIPLWSEDFANVLAETPEIDMELEHSVERIPNAFMALSELYLALKSIENSRIIFVDRPLSGTYSTLARDVRLLLKRGETNLTRIRTSAGQVDVTDLYLGLTLGPPGLWATPRRKYLHQALLAELMKGPASVPRLASSLSAAPKEVEHALKRIKRIEATLHSALLSEEEGDLIGTKERVKEYWMRLVSLALDYSASVFQKGAHPLELPDDEWLSVLDISAISFILLQHVCDLARKRRVLLIGIAKDTTATDITRAVLPYSIATGAIKPSRPLPRLKNDKAFLGILSSSNQEMRTPWRSIGYDSAFSTMLFREGEGRFISARKVVSREKLFVRSFFQLRTLRSDSHLRSSVFLFDRIHDEADASADRHIEVEERSGLSEVEPYLEGREKSRMSNLVLYILSSADNPEVFEAFGHSQLLYLADKAVKSEVRMMRHSLRAVAELRLGRMSRRRGIIGLQNTYREQRAEAEGARMRAVGGGR